MTGAAEKKAEAKNDVSEAVDKFLIKLGELEELSSSLKRMIASRDQDISNQEKKIAELTEKISDGSKFYRTTVADVIRVILARTPDAELRKKLEELHRLLQRSDAPAELEHFLTLIL